MTDRASDLPSFRKPPVDEVAIALQFSEIEPFTPIYGIFYEKVKAHYPVVEDRDPIEVNFETFSDVLERVPTAMLVEQMPPRRAWFISSDQHELIQIQATRIVQNWRKIKGEGTYPRFEPVLADFWRNFDIFQDALHHYEVESPQINQCELSYFNSIVVDERESYAQAFQRTFDWPNLQRCDSTMSAGDIRQPEASAFRWGFRILENGNGAPKARLHVTAQPALQGDQRIIRLTMVFRGPPPADASRKNLSDFLALGREVIVKTFADITSEACHELWEREN